MFIKIKLLPTNGNEPLAYIENLKSSTLCQDNIHINTDHIIYVREQEYNGTKYCMLYFTNGMIKACFYNDIAGYLNILKEYCINTGDDFDASNIESIDKLITETGLISEKEALETLLKDVNERLNEMFETETENSITNTKFDKIYGIK